MTASGIRGSRVLAAGRLLCESELGQARGRVTAAADELLHAQRHAREAHCRGEDLVRCARDRAWSIEAPAIGEQLLAMLAGARHREAAAGRDIGVRAAMLSAARQSLALVRARQKALDRLAERVVRAGTLGEVRLLAREQDEQWLRSADTRRRTG